MKTALITGGSQGIGFELAKLYAKDGYSLILCARDRVRLQEAKYEIQKLFHVRCEIISIDLSEKGSASVLYEKVKEKEIDVLVNNAGSGFTGISWQLPLEAEERMVMLNDVALMSLSKLFLNDFVQKGYGTIVNVASTGAFQPGPYIAAYYASKAFVLSYTKALAQEAKDTGVHVCCLCPGPVDTDFYLKSGGKKPRFIMSAAKAAEIAYRETGKHKTVIVPGFLNRISQILPETWRSAFVKRTKLKNLKKKNSRS